MKFELKLRSRVQSASYAAVWLKLRMFSEQSSRSASSPKALTLTESLGSRTLLPIQE